LCFTPELLKLWTFNLKVFNHKLSGIAKKIEESLTRRIQNSEITEKLEALLVNLII